MNAEAPQPQVQFICECGDAWNEYWKAEQHRVKHGHQIRKEVITDGK